MSRHVAMVSRPLMIQSLSDVSRPHVLQRTRNGATTQHMPTPKKPKNAAMNMRVAPALRAACEREAARRGLDLSSWLRMVLTDATRAKAVR